MKKNQTRVHNGKKPIMFVLVMVLVLSSFAVLLSDISIDVKAEGEWDPFLTVKSGNATGNYTLNWTASGVPSVWQHELGESTDGENWVMVNDGGADYLGQTFVNKANGTYYYRVKGYGTPNSNWSNVVIVNVGFSDMILGNTTPDENGNFMLYWSRSANPTFFQYEIRRNYSGVWSMEYDFMDVDITQYNYTNMQNGTYQFTVNDGQNTSNMVEVVVGDGITPQVHVECDALVEAIFGETVELSFNATLDPPLTAWMFEHLDNDGPYTPGVPVIWDVAGRIPAPGWYNFTVRFMTNEGPEASGTTTVHSTVPEFSTNAPVLTVPATSDTGIYQVSWTDVAGNDGYTLQESTDPLFPAGAETTDYLTGTTSHKDITTTLSGTYYYRTRAWNTTHGNGNWSTTEDIVVTLPVALDPPVINVPAISETGNYVVNWTEIANAAEYVLEEANDTMFTSPTEVYNGGNLSFSISDKDNGTYYYRVKAINGTEESDWSANKSILVTIGGPKILVENINEVAAAFGDVVILNWTATLTEGLAPTQFEVFVDGVMDNDGGYASGVPTEYNITNIINGLSEAGLYNITMRFTATLGAVSYYGSGTIWLNLSGVPPLGVPTLEIISPGGTNYYGEYALVWTEVEHATAYVLEEDDNADFTSPTETYNGTSLIHDVAGQKNGTYRYRVRAVNATMMGDWSNVRTITVTLSTLLEPAPVLGVPEFSANGTYTVNWTSVEGIQQYELYESRDGGKYWVMTADFGPETTEHQVTGKANGTYLYIVRAQNWTVNAMTNWSNVGTIVVGLGVPTLTLPDSSANGTFLISWTSMGGATGYIVEQDATGSTFVDASEIYSGSATQYWHTVDADGSYYYRVRAVRNTITGQWSAGKKLAVNISSPVNPVLPVITAPPTSTNGTYWVRWTAVENISGLWQYELQESVDGDAWLMVNDGGAAYLAELITDKENGTYHYRVKAYGDNITVTSEVVTVEVNRSTGAELQTLDPPVLNVSLT
ncbi:MAG: hypothetical protein QCI38_02465, partial [Candidatus Thermoplasmatota archaeon]|nr:hypothetical protein [Candidatus Thermoplasmatota archaeon]